MHCLPLVYNRENFISTTILFSSCYNHVLSLLAGSHCMSQVNVRSLSLSLSCRCLENDQFDKRPKRNINHGKKVDVKNHQPPLTSISFILITRVWRSYPCGTAWYTWNARLVLYFWVYIRVRVLYYIFEWNFI